MLKSLCGLLSFVNQLYLFRRKQILVRFLTKSKIGFGPTMRIKRTNRQHHRNRRLWIRPGRSNEWWSNFLAQKVIDEEWKENFRLSRENFYRLCHELQPFLVKKWSKFRKRSSVETQLAVTLYYLSDEAHYRKIANSFGIAKSTVSSVMRRTRYAITQFMP